jgi:division protein CdvB (Snf7/Vps24/ESCRT-III family)
MAFLFGGGRQSKTDTIKGFQRKVAGNARGMDREIARMDLQEAALQRELSRCAKESKLDTATLKAKEIVRLRAHKTRLRAVKEQMGGLAQQLQGVHMTGKIQESLCGTVQMLQTLNSRMDAGSVSKMLVEYERQTVQMQAKQELMDDAMDSGFEADGEQDDCNEAVISVLEEVGLDARAQLESRSNKPVQPQPFTSDEHELAIRLEKLRAP